MSKLVLLIGLALLGLSLICFTILSPLLHVSEILSKIIPLTQPVGECHTCDTLVQPYISKGSVSDLIVQGELPEQMDLNASDTIALELTTPRKVNYGQILSPTPNPINRKIVTPNISDSLEDDLSRYCIANDLYGTDCDNRNSIDVLFGSGYEVFASAYLITTSFDVQLLGPDEQSANQTKIEWDWNIFPKSAGSQIINIGVILHWKPTGNTLKNRPMEDIFRQILQSSTTIEVNPPPFIQPGQVTISGTVSGLFGLIFTGFSLTWIYEERKKRQEAKNQANVTKELPGLIKTNALTDHSGSHSISAVSPPTQFDELSQKANAYHTTLQNYSMESTPKQWASIQNNLGVIYVAQARLVEGPEQHDLLSQAVVAYHSALQVYTPEQTSAHWVRVRMNLARVQLMMASIENDKKSRCATLQEASECVEDILSYFSHEVNSVTYQQATQLYQIIQKKIQAYGCLLTAEAEA